MIRTGHVLVSISLCALVLVITPTAAHSQTSVTIGYQAVHLPDNWVTSGINFDVAPAISDHWNAVGEFGLAHDGGVDPDDEGFNIYNIGGGVRWSQRRDGATPFVQLIAGVSASTASIDTDYAFMLQPGGGVHVPLGDRWGISAQFDYRPVFYREETVNEVRFVIGARWTRP
jgi:hypothetical protein